MVLNPQMNASVATNAILTEAGASDSGRPTKAPRIVLLACVLLASASLFSASAAPQTATNTVRRVQFRESGLREYHIAEPEDATHPTWIRAERGDGKGKVELGNRVILELEPRTTLASVLSTQDVSSVRMVRSNLFILQVADSISAATTAEFLASKQGVVTSRPIMRRQLQKHGTYGAAPNDPYFTEQWHLDNRSSDGNLAGPTLNVRGAWPFTKGEQVLVGIADDGVQLDHPELSQNANGNPHYNFFKSTSSGIPYGSDANHGTSVAGLISAKQNNAIGVSGVAPNVGIASWVIFGISSLDGSETIASDEQLMDMFQYASNSVAVQNHSWGSATTELLALDALSDTGIENAVNHGRNGKGVVIVRSGGNGREDLMDVNDDGYANDPRVVAVAAIRKDGRACSYSSKGACLLVGTPSGDVIDTDGDGFSDSVDPEAPDVYTTDRTGTAGYTTTGSGDRANYTGFNGTSASSPQVAGIAALLISANTNLSYRDVQHILIQSAKHYDLADPDLKTNGAGFRFSHNAGFGVPDVGFAVQLAKAWSNRPAVTETTAANAAKVTIPDDALRVACAGSGISSTLTNIRCLPSFGPHPDIATGVLPLVYVGQANSDLTVDLTGKAALIQRGTSYFYEKIERASKAGAAFAVIFNNTGTTAIQAMGATDYVPIPAVSIGKSDGEALRDFIAANPSTTAQLVLTPAVRQLNVTGSLVCEHVGVRLKTTHSSRQDLRVTLVSPMGTRSVLQAINADSSSGPADWTYWSTQHFYESSYGTWRLEVSDERNTTINTTPFSSSPATGAVSYAQIIIQGVAITDTDHDGLDDKWEQTYFGSLEYGPKDDPDADGFNNAREQVMGTNPTKANATFGVEMALWKQGYWRLTWPSWDGCDDIVQASDGAEGGWTTLTNCSGSLPYAEWIIPQSKEHQFFRIERSSQ
jgi:subtilisin family serine protease